MRALKAGWIRRWAQSCPRPGGSAKGTALVCAAALAVTFVFVLLAPAFGVTYDERPRQYHGEQVLSFLRGQLSYADFTPDETGRHLYGGLFDATAAWVHGRLGGNVWVERHYLGAIFAGVGVLATGFLALRLAGAAVGLLAVALLALSPIYVGHSMNNPKDIPFAALCMVSLLAFTAVRSAWPFLSWGRAVLVGLALALPLNVRPGALLYFAYFGFLLATLVIRSRVWTPSRLGAVAARLIVVLVVALLAGTVFWPWAQQNPFVRPVQAMLQSAQFKWEGDMLFAGRQVAATALPWTYVPVWIAITTPPVVLCGLLWAAGATVLARKDERLWRLGLWTVGIAPIVLAIVKHSTLYDSWRHLLFVYPPLVVLAASGWRDLLVAAWKRRLLRGAAVAALAAGCAEPLLFMVRNHPNEVVYFNALVGGPQGAYLHYELDYWGNSLLEATEWSAGAAKCVGGPLAVSGWPYELVAENVSRFPSLFPTDPGQEVHHLYVQLLRDSRDGLVRTMRRGDILHVVRTTDGAPLAVVLAGPRFPEIPHWSPLALRVQTSSRSGDICSEIEAAFRRMHARSDAR